MLVLSSNIIIIIKNLVFHLLNHISVSANSFKILIKIQREESFCFFIFIFFYYYLPHDFETIALTGLSEKVMLRVFIFKIALSAPSIVFNRAEICEMYQTTRPHVSEKQMC